MFPLKDNIPTDRPAFITMALIVINVLVYFVLQRGGLLSTPDDLGVVDWGVIPYELTNPGDACVLTPGGDGSIVCGAAEPGASGQPPTIATVFSSMFMHGSSLHLAGNMLFLWIFGNNIEDAMGRARYVIFYLLGGLVALGGQVLVGPDATGPMIGASGAVAGVLGAYAVLYPRARVVTLIFVVIIFSVIELPALLMLGLWIAQQVALGAAELTGPSTGGVAYWAHIGGFVAGAALIRLFATNVKPVPIRISDA